MEEGRASFTAIAVAMWRAAHLLVDDEPKILRDNLALPLSGADNETQFRAAYDALLSELTRNFGAELTHKVATYLRAIMVMRSRYTEDTLEQALTRGVRQLVILGAGLDSFAFRRDDLRDVLQVFEVDHPASQRWKRNRLAELHMDVPPNVSFIPVDFERQAMPEELCSGRYDPGQPTFFSWLGVTQYLTEDAIFGTLRYIASAAPGSEVVFEYTRLEALQGPNDRDYLTLVKAVTSSRGEPFVSEFDPRRLAIRLREMGFSSTEDFSPEEANARYFAARTDGLRLPHVHHLMHARV